MSLSLESFSIAVKRTLFSNTCSAAAGFGRKARKPSVDGKRRSNPAAGRTSTRAVAGLAVDRVADKVEVKAPDKAVIRIDDQYRLMVNFTDPPYAVTATTVPRRSSTGSLRM